MTMASVLARQLHKAIGDRQMTQAALASQSGVDQPTISRILSGQNENPKLEALAALAHALDVSLDWLVSGQQWRSDQLAPDEDELLVCYRKAANDVMRRIMLETVRDLAAPLE